MRFGRLFGGYPDDRFTHPWFDGFWRLLIGPNRGLLLFWPALALFVWIGARWRGAWLSMPAATRVARRRVGARHADRDRGRLLGLARHGGMGTAPDSRGDPAARAVRRDRVLPG